METAETGECAAVEGRGCLASQPAPAPACGLQIDTAEETGIPGVIEGGGCRCDGRFTGATPFGADSVVFLGLLLVIVTWGRR